MEPVKDFYNRIIGYIETRPNGDQTGYDFYRRIVGRGNILSSLIVQAEAESKIKK